MSQCHISSHLPPTSTTVICRIHYFRDTPPHQHQFFTFDVLLLFYHRGIRKGTYQFRHKITRFPSCVWHCCEHRVSAQLPSVFVHGSKLSAHHEYHWSFEVCSTNYHWNIHIWWHSLKSFDIFGDCYQYFWWYLLCICEVSGKSEIF